MDIDMWYTMVTASRDAWMDVGWDDIGREVDNLDTEGYDGDSLTYYTNHMYSRRIGRGGRRLIWENSLGSTSPTSGIK